MDNRLETILKQCRVLLDHPNAENHKIYLNTRINLDMQERFIFGYFPGAKDIHLLTDIVGMNTLKDLGLVYEREIQDSSGPHNLLISYFEDQPLVMSYKDTYGNIIAIVGRSLLSDKEREEAGIEKYKNTKFIKGNHLFGLNEAKYNILRSNCAYVVEGQFDVIKAIEKGLTNIVGLGSSNMTAYQLSLLCRFTDNIKLLLDSDVAGEKGRRLIKEKFGTFANFQDIYLPDKYKDIDEYLKSNNVDDLNMLGSV